MIPKHPFAVAVVELVAQVYGISPELLWGGKRTGATTSEARWVSWAHAMEKTGWSSVETARAFGIDSGTLRACLRTLRARVRDGTCTPWVAACAQAVGVLEVTAWQTGYRIGVSEGPSRAPAPSLSGFVQVIPESSSALISSDPRPVSKRARGPKPRLRNVPETWQPNDKHRELARELRVDFDAQLTLFRDHEFKDPKSNFDAAFRTWLRRAHEYGSRTGLPPGLAQHRQVQAESPPSPIHDFLCSGDRACRARKHDQGCPRRHVG